VARRRAASGHEAEQQRDDEHDEEQVEQRPGDARRTRSDATETEDGSDGAPRQGMPRPSATWSTSSGRTAIQPADPGRRRPGLHFPGNPVCVMSSPGDGRATNAGRRSGELPARLAPSTDGAPAAVAKDYRRCRIIPRMSRPSTALYGTRQRPRGSPSASDRPTGSHGPGLRSRERHLSSPKDGTIIAAARMYGAQGRRLDRRARSRRSRTWYGSSPSVATSLFRVALESRRGGRRAGRP